MPRQLLCENGDMAVVSETIVAVFASIASLIGHSYVTGVAQGCAVLQRCRQGKLT